MAEDRSCARVSDESSCRSELCMYPLLLGFAFCMLKKDESQVAVASNRCEALCVCLCVEGVNCKGRIRQGNVATVAGLNENITSRCSVYILCHDTCNHVLQPNGILASYLACTS